MVNLGFEPPCGNVENAVWDNHLKVSSENQNFHSVLAAKARRPPTLSNAAKAKTELSTARFEDDSGHQRVSEKRQCCLTSLPLDRATTKVRVGHLDRSATCPLQDCRPPFAPAAYEAGMNGASAPTPTSDCFTRVWRSHGQDRASSGMSCKADGAGRAVRKEPCAPPRQAPSRCPFEPCGSRAEACGSARASQHHHPPPHKVQPRQKQHPERHLAKGFLIEPVL